MSDDQIQESIFVFLEARGGLVAGASERELFLMVKSAVEVEREQWKASLLDAEAAMRAAERRELFAASDERARCAALAERLGAKWIDTTLDAYNACLGVAGHIRALSGEATT